MSSMPSSMLAGPIERNLNAAESGARLACGAIATAASASSPSAARAEPKAERSFFMAEILHGLLYDESPIG